MHIRNTHSRSPLLYASSSPAISPPRSGTCSCPLFRTIRRAWHKQDGWTRQSQSTVDAVSGLKQRAPGTGHQGTRCLPVQWMIGRLRSSIIRGIQHLDMVPTTIESAASSLHVRSHGRPTTLPDGQLVAMSRIATHPGTSIPSLLCAI